MTPALVGLLALQSALPSNTSDFLKGAGAVVALVLSPFLITAIVKISREWGVRGRLMNDTAATLQKLSTSMDVHSEEVRDFWAMVSKKLERIDYILCGPDGENGLRSDVRLVVARVNSIENRNLEIDAIAAREREQYQGPEKRKDLRRFRDKLMPEIPPVDYGEGEE